MNYVKIVACILLTASCCPQGRCEVSKMENKKDPKVVLEERSVLFLGGTRSGEQTVKLEKADLPHSAGPQPQKGFFLSSQAHLEVMALGAAVPMDLNMECFTRDDFSLHSFDFNMESGGAQIALSASVKDGTLNLELTSAGNVSKQAMRLEGPIYTPDLLYQVMAKQGLKVGQSATLSVYDPMSMSLDKVQAEVKRKDALQFGGKPVETFLMIVDFKGYKQSAWVDASGICYQEESEVAGQKFMALRELSDGTTVDRPLSANIESTAPIDLLQSSYITSNVSFPESGRVKEMTVALHGITEQDVVWCEPLQTRYTPTDDQREKYPDSVFLRTQSVSYDAQRLHSAGARTEEWKAKYKDTLEPSMLIQNDNPEIIAKAAEICGDATGDWEKVSRLADWVYKEIRPEYRVTIPSAVEILKTMKGDCNEHSTLFAALVRAVGIPTKICSGIVHLEGSFGYHAWNEVLLPMPEGKEIWVPIDTTFGQKTVDATHIKLAEGGLDQQTTMAKIIGKLKLDVIEYK